jgi:hypothetical protein
MFSSNCITYQHVRSTIIIVEMNSKFHNRVFMLTNPHLLPKSGALVMALFIIYIVRTKPNGSAL